ncbi:anti-sigma-D factor RsdA [Antrihabitans cavernicola]|uniref:Type IV secretion protein Rhs n=1 Tax=Antrihabitans cavernicola TaxID=2495913 RepID=A0A5A7SE04_9NOCA|nr:anti-sigma-D factor RsdA [Spelaeibacter cavernicola]KAA0022735.1 type IV secretion protein Rhs [Spelaeibacter cavernicola]
MARESKRRFGAGSEHVDPYADTAGDGTPVDIAAVRRDDALIDAIASDGPVATDSTDEYQVATLLANWRAEITAPPLPAAPDMDEIFAAVQQEISARDARLSGGHKLRLVRPIAGAAAAIALIVGAMTAVSYNAQPGDPLWKVKEVVFSDQANSTMANSDTTSDLQEAEQLIAAGNTTEAKAHLDRASSRAGDVKDDAARQDLVAWWQRLNAELQKKGAATTTQTTPPSITGSTTASATTTADATTVAPSAPPVTAAQPPPVGPLPFPIPPEVQSLIPSPWLPGPQTTTTTPAPPSILLAPETTPPVVDKPAPDVVTPSPQPTPEPTVNKDFAPPAQPAPETTTTAAVPTS